MYSPECVVDVKQEKKNQPQTHDARRKSVLQSVTRTLPAGVAYVKDKRRKSRSLNPPSSDGWGGEVKEVVTAVQVHGGRFSTEQKEKTDGGPATEQGSTSGRAATDRCAVII